MNTGLAQSSPRLSTVVPLSALLTIIDDEAGAGLFRLEPTSDTVEEEDGRFSFSISREGGNQGRVAVVVQTVEGNTQDESESQNVSTGLKGMGQYIGPIEIESYAL